MLTLDLTNAPRWYDLGPGVRVQLRPLTTALMVATRRDPAVEAVPGDASDEERAVAFAKALARRAVLGWEGIGDADGKPIDPSLGRVHLCHTGDPQDRWRRDGAREPERAGRLHRHGGGAGPAAGDGPCGRERQPRGGVVRRRPARGILQGPARGRGVGQVDHARHLVGQWREPCWRLPRQPRRRGPSRLWRHAVRLRGGAGDPGDEGARAAGHLLSLHLDGRALGQHASEPVFRQRGRIGPARLPLAGADHVFACSGVRRERGQDRHGRKSGRGALRRGHARQLQYLGRERQLDRHARRLGPAPNGAALRPSLRGGGWGRRLPDRHRDAGADDDPLGRVQLSGGAGLSGPARGCALDPRVGDEDRLCRRLERVFRAPAGRWQRRRVLPPRSALGRSEDRFHRHRQLHAAVGLARRVRASRRGRGLARDLRPSLPAGEHRGRRRLRLVLCQRGRSVSAVPLPHHGRCRRQALGVPLQGSARLVVERALQPPERGGERDADRLGAAVEADLVHRVGLSRHRPRDEPAERLLRPEVIGELHAAFLAGLARRRHPARLSRGDVSLVGRGCEQPGLLGLRRPHGACARMRRLDLGRTAVPVLPGAHRCLDGRWQLEARPLADRAARGGVTCRARPAPPPPRRAARGSHRRHRPLGRGRGLRHHGAGKPARLDHHAVAPLRLRRRGDRGSDPLRHARPGVGRQTPRPISCCPTSSRRRPRSMSPTTRRCGSSTGSSSSPSSTGA